VYSKYVYDVCDRAHIPKAIADYSQTFFKSIKLELAHLKFKEEALAIYALREALTRHKEPRTMQEIQYCSGITMKTLWRIEKALFKAPTDAHPTEYVPRFCLLLGLEYCHINPIRECVLNLYGMRQVRAHVLCAAVIFTYCEKLKINRSLKKICECCGCVCASNVNKIIKSMHITNVVDALVC
jgi:hypothetical protein